jgi:hypothetical protein
MNIQDTHVYPEVFLNVLAKEHPAFIATLASLNLEWYTATADELQNRLHHRLNCAVPFVDQHGFIHLKQTLGTDVGELYHIEDTQINTRSLLRYLNAIQMWSTGDESATIPSSVDEVFNAIDTNDVVITRNTALFLLCGLWSCLKLPKCWGTSCDRNEIPYGVVDITLLTEWENMPRNKAAHMFWMFLFLRFAMFYWHPDMDMQLDTVKLMLVIVEVSSYLRFQVNNADLPLPLALREQVSTFLSTDFIESENQGVCTEGALGQPDDADGV